MKIADLYEASFEHFPFEPGTGPKNIVDYRKLGSNKGQWVKYGPSVFHGREYPGGRRFDEPKRVHAVLTSTGAILYYYGDNNRIKWSDLLNIANRDMDKTIQHDVNDIIVKKNGWLISRSREFMNWFKGERSRYSNDLKHIVQRLVDVGLARSDTPIWLGNWASGKGEYVGNVGKILTRSDVPNTIVVYHGTSTYRLSQITKTGLKALPLEDRVWNKGSLDKTRPAHREDSVYLTANRTQAEYYARKAVNVDRKRFGPKGRSDASRNLNSLESNLQRYQYLLKNPNSRRPIHSPMSYSDRRIDDYSWMTEEWLQKEIVKIQSQIEKLRPIISYYGKIEPVILQITLTKTDQKKLMADDDYLSGDFRRSPENWQDSLSHFGQIAFRGTIPPDRIKIIAQGNTAGRNSH